jgi:hypothetical protein
LLISYHQIAGEKLSSNFIKNLGYTVDLVANSNRLRVSPSDAEVYIKRLLNKSYPQISNSKIISNILKKIITEKYP